MAEECDSIGCRMPGKAGTFLEGRWLVVRCKECKKQIRRCENCWTRFLLVLYCVRCTGRICTNGSSGPMDEDIGSYRTIAVRALEDAPAVMENR
jgi:hypothetical protein